MAKPVTRFVCQACGAVYPKWIGRCTGCGAWSSVVEEIATKAGAGGATPQARAAVAQPIGQVDADLAARISTGLGEFDRVLGGGAVLGGVVLLGGDPGVGKSTLLMQALAGLSRAGARSLYVSGEESAGQTAARARRLGAVSENLLVLAESDLDAIERVIAEVKPAAVVLDSVQTVRAPSLESPAGTVSQLREVASRLVERTKRERTATFLVGHVTKDGMLAGPKVLEHLVDTVLAFEGERGQSFRTLRVQKNRYGSATELGIFDMTSEGMREVTNPSELFLAERPRGASGSVVASTCEGTRPMLVEIQALVVPSMGPGRRTTTGVDGARLAMILAVLERKAGLSLGSCDVFVNVAGGMRLDEPALDLPIAIAVASSLRDRPVPAEVVAFGEVGLAGEVRAVARGPSRITEAAALGFRRAIVPAALASAGEGAGIEVVAARTVEEAIAAVSW
jgi:DNA repair protein RadA/Sms